MPKKALIRLKAKTTKPKRQKIEESVELYEGINLAETIEKLGGDLSQIFVKIDNDYYDEHSRTYLCLSRMQTDEEYGVDLQNYQKRFASYEKWYKENEETILAEIARRKEEAVERRHRVLESERNHLEKELRRLDKHLRK